MIGKPPADGMEIIVALLQRVEEMAERENFDVARFFQTRDPRRERIRLANGERGVGAKRRIHTEAGARQKN